MPENNAPTKPGYYWYSFDERGWIVAYIRYSEILSSFMVQFDEDEEYLKDCHGQWGPEIIPPRSYRCIICGEMFYQYDARQRYGSNACKQKVWRLRNKAKAINKIIPPEDK